MGSGSSKKKVPVHVAIIMDGNRRWAKMNGFNIKRGYEAGTIVIEKIFQEAKKMGIKYLTLFAFSKENWNRNKTEIEIIMNTAMEVLSDSSKNSVIKSMVDNGAKIVFIGSRKEIIGSLLEKLNNLEELSAKNTGPTVQIAINYSGKSDILHATKNIVAAIMENKTKEEDINEEIFSSNLMTSNSPDPDLLIRTGAEKRISNFLLWQISYCELYFSDRMWPEFSVDDFHSAIEDYNSRNRKYGA